MALFTWNFWGYNWAHGIHLILHIPRRIPKMRFGVLDKFFGGRYILGSPQHNLLSFGIRLDVIRVFCFSSGKTQKLPRVTFSPAIMEVEELVPFKTCFRSTGVIFHHDYEKKGTGTTKTRGDKLTYMVPRDIFLFFAGDGDGEVRSGF